MTPSVGGSTPWCSASAALIRPATPAVAFVWPIIDLTEPMATLCAGAPASANTLVSACTSAPSPATVPVPCASTSPTVAGEKPAWAYARRSARIWPSGRGAVRLRSRPSLALPMPRITA